MEKPIHKTLFAHKTCQESMPVVEHFQKQGRVRRSESFSDLFRLVVILLGS